MSKSEQLNNFLVTYMLKKKNTSIQQKITWIKIFENNVQIWTIKSPYLFVDLSFCNFFWEFMFS